MANMPEGVSSSGQQNRPGEKPPTFSPLGAANDAYNTGHTNSDVDSGHMAIHHTLGRGTFQAAPGTLVESVYLIGEVKMWLLDTPPKGFLMMDGATLNRDDYPELVKWAKDSGQLDGASGRAFGPGNSTTTFQMPDMRHRVPLGNSMNGPNTNLGLTDGITNVNDRIDQFQGNHSHAAVVTPEKAPNHGHSIPDGGGHGHTVQNAGSHSHSMDSYSHNQESNTNVVDGTNNRLTGPTNHSHAIYNSGDHTHEISQYGGYHQHSALDVDETHVVAATHEHVNSFTTGYRKWVGDDQFPTNPVGFNIGPPFMVMNFIMRYTSLLDFEGSDFSG